MFIMHKRNASEKALKKTPGINYSAANCRIFSAYFNSESKTSLLQVLNLQTGRRRYWMMQYNHFWFETTWGTREDDITKELWKKEFRMSVETFKYLLDLIGVNLQGHDTRFRKKISRCYMETFYRELVQVCQ